MSNSLQRWLEQRDLSPFHDLSKVESTFNRLMSDMLNTKKNDKEFTFSPSCDILDEGANYILKFDMPGVTKENIHVETDKNILTVRAERHEEKKKETKQKFRSEVYYGQYMRSFSLPGPIEDKKIDAKFENGVLTVVLPKASNSESKQIPVH
jgi:HSP20 family protein